MRCLEHFHAVDVVDRHEGGPSAQFLGMAAGPGDPGFSVRPWGDLVVNSQVRRDYACGGLKHFRNLKKPFGSRDFPL
jgi:hypothetical protein